MKKNLRWAQVFGEKSDWWNRAALRLTGKRVILNCARQWGKSTVTAAKALWEAKREARSLIVVVSPSDRQSSEFLRKVEEAVRAKEEMFDAVRPMLAVRDGALWLLSTPCGKRGYFYRMWTHGGSDWERVTAPATECARIKADHLERERRGMTEERFRTEYVCEFADDEESLYGVEEMRLL